MRKRSVLRSLVAGALIGVAEAAPMASVRRLRRPLGVVWIDDRDLQDPLGGLPLVILEPVPLDGSLDQRRDEVALLRLTLTRPFRLLERFRSRLHPG